MSPGVFLFRVVITLLCALGAINVAAFFVAYFRPDLLPRFYQLFLGRKVRVQAEYVDDDEPAKAVAYAAPVPDEKMQVLLAADADDHDRIHAALKGLNEIENVEVVGPSGNLEDLSKGHVFWLLRPTSSRDPDPWVEFGFASALHGSGILSVVVSGPRGDLCVYTMRPGDWKEGDPPWVDTHEDDLGLAAVKGLAKAYADILEKHRALAKEAKP